MPMSATMPIGTSGNVTGSVAAGTENFRAKSAMYVTAVTAVQKNICVRGRSRLAVTPDSQKMSRMKLGGVMGAGAATGAARGGTTVARAAACAVLLFAVVIAVAATAAVRFTPMSSASDVGIAANWPVASVVAANASATMIVHR